MDRIIAKGLLFYGKHGVLASEKETVQRFIIDLVLYKDLQEAGQKDDLIYTVNYAMIFNDIREIVENKTFNLIEALADNICEMILSKYAVESVEVTVYKPDAPVNGDFDYFAVEIKRNRK